jgi:hypothetical protein
MPAPATTENPHANKKTKHKKTKLFGVGRPPLDARFYDAKLNG